MFYLYAELTPSAWLNKLSTTNPPKSLALASTQICCKYWVHILHVTFTTLLSVSIAILKSSLQLHLLKVSFDTFFLSFFSLKEEDY